MIRSKSVSASHRTDNFPSGIGTPLEPSAADAARELAALDLSQPLSAPTYSGDQNELRKRAVDLFTFLRELVSLRTTVVRNCESYDHVLWIHQVPKDGDCDCIAYRQPKDDEADEWWLRVRKPSFTEPPAPPPELAAWIRTEQWMDSALEAPKPLDSIKVNADGTPSSAETRGTAKLIRIDEHPELRMEWDRYVASKWTAWAAEDRRKRQVMKVYTDLFTLYQQQRELGESYEVIVALGQLRWQPKPGVEVNRHVVAVQTSIEFDSQRGVITVVPAAEGAKPRLEEDMLELDERPSPDVLTALEHEVAQCDDDVWHNADLHATLKKFAHHLGQGEGIYGEEFEPVEKATNVPQMRWAPAIIVRHRTEQDLLQVYGRILEDLKKRPEVAPGLIPLVEVGWREPGQEVNRQPISENAPDLMFPLHSNDEQREIVHQLQRQSGVVVQGPPGTGKSHTIANLVCHLLATGHRVLVTSHAPRALRILKDKIPAAITNMCVVLLGNDRTALAELESSVQVITQQLNSWNPQAREAAIKELEEQVQTLRGRAAEVDKHLRAFRESDTFKHPELEGGYGGTLQHIAQTLRSQQNRYGWITQYTQGLELDQLPPEPGLTNDEALLLLQGLRAVDSARRADLKRELPQPPEVLSPEQFEQMVSDEQQWRTAFDQAKAAAAGDAPLVPTDLDAELMMLKELLELVEQIIRYNSEMASSHYSWVPRLARDIRSGQYDQWKALLENTTPKMNLIKEQPEQAYELDIAGLGNIDIAQLHEDLEVLGKHLEGGGKLTSFFRYVGPAAERRYIFDNITIGGAKVRTNETLAQLRAWAAVQYQLKDLQQLWADISAPPLGPVVRRLPIWTAWCGIIESAQLMHMSIHRAKDLFGKLPMVKLPSWHDIDQLQLMHKQLKVVVMHKEHQNRRHAIDELAERQSKRGTSPTSHNLISKIADTIRRRDIQGYTAVYAQLKDLWAEREKWAHSDVLLKKLAERLPKVAQALSDDPTDAVWEARCGSLREMWLWLRADRWLKQQLDPRHFEYLQGERKSLQDHIQGTMVKLTAEKSWYHCMSRMTPAEETYLKAWMQAIRNIGAGTGKRANRFRKVARQTLERCRSAIPAWIMPIHRVAETVVPGEDRFDVVIVDEASQSGAEALFLHYIAKKIIIVGDDKQIAPYNVGINRDDVELLRSRHIPDLPLSDYYDLDHSFFDQAFLRFGNRIRLIEHFRCMPEIIQFSNELCYGSEPLLPLRQYGDGRMEPVVIAKHVNGHMEGASPNVANKVEADAIVRQIAKCVADPAYRDKTFGVISLLGEKQAELIESKLLAAIGPEEMERRRLICGDAYSFQGDERHVMFLSLVVAADEGRRLATLTQAADERRFNVAASRARDQMWLFHSANPEDLSSKCLRRRLLEYCMHPHVPQEPGDEISIQELEAAASTADRARAPAPPPFESWLEVDVYLQVRRRGYRVLPQHNFAGYKIDLVVMGSLGRLAVECNGEDWHGQEHYDSDMTRQRQLERCGWRFWRIRGGVFYRNPEQALQPLWELLDKQGIKPQSPVDPTSAASIPTAPVAPMVEGGAEDEEDVDVEVTDVEEDDEPTPVRKAPSRTRKPAAKKTTRRASDSSKDAKSKNRKVA